MEVIHRCYTYRKVDSGSFFSVKLETRTKISVIISAYNRKDYLLSALDSVLNQTIERSLYEIIVVTNFECNFIPIDKYYEEGIKITILKREGQIGEFWFEALKKSNGELICFLDDDDIFEPEKLNYVLRVFNDKPNLCYYSNDITFINSESNTIIPVKSNAGGFRRKLASMNVNVRSKKALIFKFESNRGHALNSTISVRKEVVMEHLDLIKNTFHSEDQVVFILALNSGLDLYLDRNKLTRFRVGSNNSSTISNNESDLNISRVCSTKTHEIRTFKYMISKNEIFKDNNIVWCLDHSYSLIELVNSAICESSRINSISSILRLTKNNGHLINRMIILTILLAFVSFFSPTISKRLYLIFGGFMI